MAGSYFYVRLGNLEKEDDMQLRKISVGYWRHGYTIIQGDEYIEQLDFMAAVAGILKPIVERTDSEFNDVYEMDLWQGQIELQTYEEGGVILLAPWHPDFNKDNIKGCDYDPPVKKGNLPEWAMKLTHKIEKEDNE